MRGIFEPVDCFCRWHVTVPAFVVVSRRDAEPLVFDDPLCGVYRVAGHASTPTSPGTSCALQRFIPC